MPGGQESFGHPTPQSYPLPRLPPPFLSYNLASSLSASLPIAVCSWKQPSSAKAYFLPFSLPPYESSLNSVRSSRNLSLSRVFPKSPLVFLIVLVDTPGRSSMVSFFVTAWPGWGRRLFTERHPASLLQQISHSLPCCLQHHTSQYWFLC